ncbi:MAG: hypothetical protein DRG30_00500 [Epsilonproteobacteria bacterium]|nr:MAG: hypothetical protein DRG30_00500 [Campylobacterota bacterium]
MKIKNDNRVKILCFLLLTVILSAQNHYIEQIKVVDACLHLAEPTTIDALGVKGNGLKSKRDIDNAIEACTKSMAENSDDAHVQFLLGRAYTKSGEYPKGLMLARKSCQNGDSAGCTLLAIYYDKGFAVKRSSAKKYLLLSWACSHGDPLGCFNLAVTNIRRDPYAPRKSKQTGAGFFDICVGGMYDRACIRYANNMYFKKFPYDEERFEYASYKACLLGDEVACYDLEKVLKQKEDTHIQKKIYYALEISCRKKNAKACERLGIMHQNEATRSANLEWHKRNEKACIQGNMSRQHACYNAGGYYFQNSRDIAKAIAYWEKSCHDREHATSCFFLGKFYLDDKNAEHKDKEKRYKLLRKDVC